MDVTSFPLQGPVKTAYQSTKTIRVVMLSQLTSFTAAYLERSQARPLYPTTLGRVPKKRTVARRHAAEQNKKSSTLDE